MTYAEMLEAIKNRGMTRSAWPQDKHIRASFDGFVVFSRSDPSRPNFLMKEIYEATDEDKAASDWEEWRYSKKIMDR